MSGTIGEWMTQTYTRIYTGRKGKKPSMPGCHVQPTDNRPVKRRKYIGKCRTESPAACAIFDERALFFGRSVDGRVLRSAQIVTQCVQRRFLRFLPTIQIWLRIANEGISFEIENKPRHMCICLGILCAFLRGIQYTFLCIDLYFCIQ